MSIKYMQNVAGFFLGVSLFFSISGVTHAAGLPEGTGKDVVEGMCTTCHQTNQITRSSGYSAPEWEELTSTMIALSAAPEQRNEIITYLAQNFPPNERRAPKIISGRHKIEFQEWQVPTLGQRSRDPIQARDGSIWWAGQFGNLVGRLDPATGDIRLVTPPTPGSRPYGIKIDANGNPWVACNGSNCLIKVDPKTMALTEIKLPIPETTVRRLDIAEDGIIWYVNSSQGRLGSYDPKSGVIREWPSPSGPKSHPYAIVITNGIIWYNESGMRPDVLVRFDPKTEEFQSWPIPSGGVYAGIIRHMRPSLDGNLLIHQSSTNRIIKVMVKDTATQ